jgi:capsular polysaccharide biosynthesis protein
MTDGFHDATLHVVGRYCVAQPKRKLKALIFGTGAGGVYFFQNNGSRYDVVGFLDNNRQKQGQSLFGRPIHAPAQIDALSFDRIIIASDYYLEIYTQLTEVLAVHELRIEVFHSTMGTSMSRREALRKRVESMAYERICRNRGSLSNILYRRFFPSYKGQPQSVKRMPIRWLDQADDAKVHVFRASEAGFSQGPRFIDQDVKPSPLQLPEVALYRFSQAQVGSVSRVIVLPSGQVVIERVTTSNEAGADYSCAQLVYHGEQLALVRTQTPERLDRGIWISGVSELNYYHWIVEILGQLQYIAELPADYADHPILITQQSQSIPSIKAMIAAMGLERRLVLLGNQNTYEVDDLLVISAPNFMVPNFKGACRNSATTGYVRPESIGFLRETGFRVAAHALNAPWPKRVFLGRMGYLRRYNQREVLQQAERYGFACVYMEDLDLAQQVAVMANAEYVIGPTGAAWTNILFAAPETKALCWMADQYHELSCFSNLAAVVGVELDYLTYHVESNDSRELYYRAYEVDITRISTWLEKMLTQQTVEKVA